MASRARRSWLRGSGMWGDDSLSSVDWVEVGKYNCQGHVPARPLRLPLHGRAWRKASSNHEVPGQWHPCLHPVRQARSPRVSTSIGTLEEDHMSRGTATRKTCLEKLNIPQQFARESSRASVLFGLRRGPLGDRTFIRLEHGDPVDGLAQDEFDHRREPGVQGTWVNPTCRRATQR